MTITAWFLLVLGVAVLVLVICLLVPLPDPEPRTQVTPPEEREVERKGRHRTPDDEITRRLGDSRLRWPYE